MSIIQARGVVKKFGSIVAVDGVDLDVEQGECFGLLGPNGAGKTSLVRMITAVSPITAGTIWVDGKDITKEPRQIKALIGVVPQEDNLDPDLTVRENLILYSQYFDIAKEEAGKRADELLAFFQLEAKKGTGIEKLSGGMKRRLLLARALINRPKILILDEPTTGLDPQARHLIWDQLKLLRSQGSTIILTTHYMDEAERLCDRLVIMDNGKILEEGSPKALIEKHVGVNVVEAENSPRVLDCIKRHTKAKGVETVGDMVYVSTEEPQQVIGSLLEECGVTTATVRRATLEDVFLKLTGRVLRE